MLNKQIKEQIDNMPIRELYVKLELLNWQEQNIKEIQGVLTGGNVNVNGDSSVRRTCTFNFVSADDKEIEQYIQLNTKFRLFVGLKNRLPKQFRHLGDIPFGTLFFFIIFFCL